MLHSKIIKKEDIDIIFNSLSEEYEMVGGNQTINIYLVGGAAIVLDFSNTYDYFLERAKEAFETPIQDFDYLFK